MGTVGWLLAAMEGRAGNGALLPTEALAVDGVTEAGAVEGALAVVAWGAVDAVVDGTVAETSLGKEGPLAGALFDTVGTTSEGFEAMVIGAEGVDAEGVVGVNIVGVSVLAGTEGPDGSVGFVVAAGSDGAIDRIVAPPDVKVIIDGATRVTGASGSSAAVVVCAGGVEGPLAGPAVASGLAGSTPRRLSGL